MSSLPSSLLALLAPHLTPDLLRPSYRARWTPENPMLGLCSVASEAAWFVLGGTAQGWVPQVARDEEGGTHWWLEGPEGRVDLTASQYTLVGRPLPYAQGRGAGFMGIRQDPGNPWGFSRKPSARAQRVLTALVEEHGSVADVRAVLRAEPVPTLRRRVRP